jgi:hypothetical protein
MAGMQDAPFLRCNRESEGRQRTPRVLRETSGLGA